MTHNHEKKTVLVTGVGGRSVGGGILHALLRTSPEVAERYRVLAVDCDPFSWGLYKAQNGFVVPRADSEEYISRIADIVQNNNVDAIIPGTEIEIAPLLQHSDHFAPAEVIANRFDLLPLMYDKLKCAEKLEQLGIAVVPTLSASSWHEAAEKFGFPLIVKPAMGSGGSRGVSIACNENQMEQRLSNRSDADRDLLCVQPYIGDEEGEFTVGVLSDRSGKLIDSVALRRNLVGLSLMSSSTFQNKKLKVSSGYSQGYIVRDKKIQDFCEEVAVALNSCGPLNLQLRVDPKTGDPLIFEVHPRFSGTTPIRADVGFNEPDLMLRNSLFGETFGRLNYRADVAVIRAFEHIVVPFEQLKAGT